MARILVIDDEVTARNLFRDILETEGHTVYCLDDGLRVSEVCEEFKPDLLITDILMPTCDGLEIISKVRKNYPTLKLIAVSGGGRLLPEECLPPAKMMGAVRTLAKPFRMDALLATVNDVLGPDFVRKLA